MTPGQENLIKDMLAEHGAYEMLWVVAEWIEKDWPEGFVGQNAPMQKRRKMKDAAYDIKHTAHSMLL
jgi:hypothetical protein